ncbi:MAG TPA: universal stress protein [Acidimicrobiales bacterium]|nr:universal stress protein [Acidimicrobiales bacterium]
MTSRYVVGIDGSDRSTRALEWAAGEAEARGADVDAVLVWRFPFEEGPFVVSAGDQESTETLWKQTLDEVVDAVQPDHPNVTIRRLAIPGTHQGEALVQHAEGADLLVVGTRGRGGFIGLLIGSVAEHCLDHAACPTAFIPDDLPADVSKVVVGIDGSPGSQAALSWAAERSRTLGGEVAAVYVWNSLDQPKEAQFDTYFSTEDAHAYLVENVEAAGLGAGDVHLEVVNDLPSRALIEAAGDAGLLVIGARGKGKSRVLLTGSVARQVARHTPVPLIVHR